MTTLAPNPEQIFEQQQKQVKLLQAIHKLPANLRKAVQTRITGDCSVKEVAYRLNISQAAAKSSLYRASMRLGSLITASYGSRANGNMISASRICKKDRQI